MACGEFAGGGGAAGGVYHAVVWAWVAECDGGYCGGGGSYGSVSEVVDGGEGRSTTMEVTKPSCVRSWQTVSVKRRPALHPVPLTWMASWSPSTDQDLSIGPLVGQLVAWVEARTLSEFPCRTDLDVGLLVFSHIARAETPNTPSQLRDRPAGDRGGGGVEAVWRSLPGSI